MIDRERANWLRSSVKGVRVYIVGGPERFIGKPGEIVGFDIGEEYPLRVYVDGYWDDAVRFRIDQVKPIHEGDLWLWDVLKSECKMNEDGKQGGTRWSL